jgi:hypothetical protein
MPFVALAKKGRTRLALPKGKLGAIAAVHTMEPIEPPWLAIKEWIADAALWPCRLQDTPPDLVFHDAPPGCGRNIPDDEPALDWFHRPRNPNEPDPDWFDQSPAWKPEEIHLDDGRTLVLEYT